jgi:hypothetical protein
LIAAELEGSDEKVAFGFTEAIEPDPLESPSRGKGALGLLLKLYIELGVEGACAIWAMPLAPRSMDNSVVGLVLAAALLKVCGLEMNDEEEREGTGEEGEEGGKGRMEASSSASPENESFHDEIVDRLSDISLSTLIEYARPQVPSAVLGR